MASDQFWHANIQYHSLLGEAIPHGARHVLDVGCGDGILSAQLARAGVAHVVGLDLDPGVLDRARTRHRGVTVEWRQGDLFDVPYDAGSFDAVVSVATLHHLNAGAGLKKHRYVFWTGGVMLPYVLVVAVVLISLVGLTRLNRSRQFHGVPWTSLLTWAILFGGGVAIWLSAVHGH